MNGKDQNSNSLDEFNGDVSGILFIGKYSPKDAQKVYISTSVDEPQKNQITDSIIILRTGIVVKSRHVPLYLIRVVLASCDTSQDYHENSILEGDTFDEFNKIMHHDEEEWDTQIR